MKVNDKNQGFAVVEVLLLLLIVALIAGVGYWVYSHRTAGTSQTTTQTTGESKPVTQKSSFTATLQKNSEDEDKAASAAADNFASSATSDASAAANLGEVYNESSL